MTSPRINECAWAADVISEINRLASSRHCTIRSAGGEWSVAADALKTVLFPDVLIFGDPSRTAVLQGWELKMPDTPITNEDLLRNAESKARALELGSFLVWNVREAALYVNVNDTFSIKTSWNCNCILSRDDVRLHREDWVCLLCRIIDDLNTFFDRGEIIRPPSLDRQAEVIVTAIVNRCQGQLEDYLKNQAARSRSFRAEISAWWRDSKAEHLERENEWQILAVEILLHWIHRFLFAHYLKRFVADVRSVEELSPAIASTVSDAEAVFENISMRHDFAQIFRPHVGAQFMPSPVWNELLAFNGFLRSASLDTVNQELLQLVLSSISNASRRKIAGQFCTPRPLADLLVRLTMDDVHVPFIDPCCGTGTIAKAACEFKVKHGMSMAEALATTWASDKHSMPLQFAALALASGEAPATTVRVFQHDLANLRVGELIKLVDATTGQIFDEPLPAFSCIVLNPPFVRFEDWKNPRAAEIARFVSRSTGIELSRKSDLFAPLILHLWRLADNDSGRIGVVVSNSWLGADWGGIFRAGLRKLFHLEAVVASANGRWFKNAKVVTNLLVLRKRIPPNEPHDDEAITFSTSELPIEDWDESYIDEIVDTIVHSTAHSNSSVTVNRVTTRRLKSLDSLGLCWTAHFSDLSWLDRVCHDFIPVTSFFDIKRGERCGWDDLFFPPDNVGIETDYLFPVLKSSADTTRLQARPDGVAFCCSASLEELQQRGHDGALRWIERFAGSVNGKGKLLPQVLARSGMQWYEMRPDTVADLAVSMNPDRRLFIIRLVPRSFVNQRLIRFTLKQDSNVDIELCHALLCSLMGSFYLEALGFGRGLGVLDLNATKIAGQLRMLNPNLISTESRTSILSSFRNLFTRDVLSFHEEIQCEDRINFENSVLLAFGLEELSPIIANTVWRLQKIRLAARE